MRRHHRRKNKAKRSIIWLKTDVYAKNNARLKDYIRSLFRDESNYQELVNRLEANSPGIFTNPMSNQFGKQNDKKAIIDMVYEHAKATRDNLPKKYKHSNEQIIKLLLNTRTFVSKEELIQTNIKTFLQKRKPDNKAIADELRRLLGTKRIDYSTITYNEAFSFKNEQGVIEQRKAYVFGDSGIALTMSGTGSTVSPYVFSIQILAGREKEYRR